MLVVNYNISILNKWKCSIDSNVQNNKVYCFQEIMFKMLGSVIDVLKNG